MAINYTNLFTILGKYVKALNTHQGFFTTIQTGIDDIEGILESNSLNRLAGNMHTVMERANRDVEQWATGLINAAKNVITDRDYIQEELSLVDTSFNGTIQEIMEDMNDNSQSILESEQDNDTFVSNNTIWFIGSESPVKTTSLLDGVSSPGSNISASRQYLNIDSELFPSIVFSAECTSSPSEGEETFVLVPLNPQTQPYQDQEESPGVSQQFQFINKRNIISDGSGKFENFVNNVPNGWTVSGGTAGTDYEKYNVSFRGDTSLVIKDQTITLTKFITNIVPGKSHFVTIRTSDSILPTDHTNVKSGGQSDSVTITMSGELKDGTSWTKTTGVLAANLFGVSEDWKPSWLQFATPFNIKTDTIKLSITLTPFSGDWFMLDDVIIGSANYFAGTAFAIVAGIITDQLQVGDTISNINLAYGGEGVFQTFFRKAFGVQLPSSGSPSISDTLAT